MNRNKSTIELNKVYLGDCLKVLKRLPDNLVSTILTDPPYDLTGKSGNGGFMGKKWDASGIAFNPEVWAEALRVAKPGATLMAFGGSRTYHRLTCAIEDAGWEIRDCISYFHDGTQAERAFMASLSEEQLGAYLELHRPGAGMGWVYGSGIGLGYNVSKGIDKAAGAEREVVGFADGGNGTGRKCMSGTTACGRTRDTLIGLYKITAPATPLAAKFDGWNSRLKPAVEYIVMAQAPLDGTYAANAEKWGVAGLNIDGGRVGIEEGETITFRHTEKTSRSSGIMGETSTTRDGEIFVNTKGRFPANVIHDGSEEVLAEFDKAGVRKSTGGDGSGFGKNSAMFQSSGKAIIRDNGSGLGLGDSGTPARYFAQCPPDPTAHPDAARFHYCPKAGKRERGKGNNHPTVKPLSLLRYLAKLTRPPDGGIVLDPFGGSGTTALACIAEGRDYIIIEKEPEYAELCRRRIAEYTGAEVAPVEVEVKSEVVKQMSLW